MRRLLPILILGLSLFSTAEISNNLYQRLPRLEDELAYLYQAQLFAQGRLYAQTPPEAVAWGVPHVVDFEGKRFSKYPPGGSLWLALGLQLGSVWLIGPLTGTLALALTYRLGKMLYGSTIGLIALLMGAISPFYLVLTPALMAHTASMLAALIFILIALTLRSQPASPSTRWLSLAAGLALGCEFLIRPYTAVWSAAPLAGLALYDFRKDFRSAMERYGLLTIAFGILASLLIIYNFILTNQLRLSLYELWWPFDRLGFGPDVGPYGFTPVDSLKKTVSDLLALSYDLQGVPYLSVVPLLLGLLLPRHNRLDLFLFSTLMALLVGALFYHSGSRLYGPRYFYEAWPMMMVLTARGFHKVFSLVHNARLLRMLGWLIAALYFGIALAFYVPFRFDLMKHVYQDTLTSDIVNAVQQAGLHQALVFQFADDWPEAAAGMMRTDPALQSDILYPRYLSPDSYRNIIAAYPDRVVYFWRAGRLSPATNPPPDWQPTYPIVRYPNP
jgi:hypothetical protein